MKKFKFIMPALALVFAVATAFATAKEDVQTTTAWYFDGDDCVTGELDGGKSVEDCTNGTINCTVNGKNAYESEEKCDDGDGLEFLKFD